MPPELRLHPERLRSHAAAAAALSEELRAVLPGMPEPAAGSAAAEEQERLRAAVLGAVRELAELSATIAGVAAAAEQADGEIARSLRHLLDTELTGRREDGP